MKKYAMTQVVRRIRRRDARESRCSRFDSSRARAAIITMKNWGSVVRYVVRWRREESKLTDRINRQMKPIEVTALALGIQSQNRCSKLNSIKSSHWDIEGAEVVYGIGNRTHDKFGSGGEQARDIGRRRRSLREL